MRKLALLLLSLILLGACNVGPAEEHHERVLFVGNSLVYVGNLPAVFSALAAANDHAVHSDMIVKGGATLDERVADGSVKRALATHNYTTLVLQERGGDLMCSFGPDSCIRSREAIKELSELARKKGVGVILLGTYQSLASSSRSLVEAESFAAADAGIPYIEVSEKLQHLRAIEPELSWFYTDGMHPGKDLVLLDAVLIHRQVFGSFPRIRGFTVDAPIYTTDSGLGPGLRAADAPPPKAGTPQGTSYAGYIIGKLLPASGPTR